MAFEKLQEHLKEYRRVIRLTKKPTKNEFWTIVKVSGIGLLLIGLLGFVISLAKALLFGGL